MEQHMIGIRSTFYLDVTRDYRARRTKSFLYRAFREESVAGLRKELRELKKDFPWLPSEESLKSEKDLIEKLKESMKAHPDQARDKTKDRCLLLKKPPKKINKKLKGQQGKERSERRDFWLELYLNDVGYKAGVLTDTEYYVWLIEYLTERGIYYKDSSSMWSGHTCLHELLRAGLPGRDVRSRAQTETALEELAQRLRDERDAGKTKTAGRLHDLKQSIRTKEGTARTVDYLPQLTAKLKQMALHNKIKTWLQDSGYPLKNEKKQPEEDSSKAEKQPSEDSPKAEKQSPKGPRKQDFSMRLFEAYCDSPEGYNFSRKSFGWHLEGEGFCVLGVDAQQLQELLNALERRRKQSGTTYLYLPLAVHMLSGCTFFLAGKDIYEDLYEDMDKASSTDYDKAEAAFCFDFLRLDEDWYGQKAVGGEFRLQPAFLENMGKSYDVVLDEFKRYCVIDVCRAVREFNDEFPDSVSDAFRWAFDEPDDYKQSRSASAAFHRIKNKPQKDPWGLPV